MTWMRAHGFNPDAGPPPSALARSRARQRQIEGLEFRAERHEQGLKQADTRIDRDRIERRLDAVHTHIDALQAQEHELHEHWPASWRCDLCDAPTGPPDYGHARCATCSTTPTEGG